MLKRNQVIQSTLPIGTYLGIPLKVHWSFILIFIMSFWMGFKEGFDIWEHIILVFLFLSIFLCVTLHEYGHAWMASILGVPTRDIILSPIGGVARLDHMPKEPQKELKIALAGPAVNLIIFGVLSIPLIILFVMGNLELRPYMSDLKRWDSFLLILASSNLILFLFNLIPAFPMDGGRVLRALLSMRMNHLKATIIASNIGKVLALIWVGLGIYTGNYLWSAVGLFIYMMADMEAKYLRQEETFNAISAKDIMNSNIQFVFLHTSMEELIQQFFEVGERHFIVLNSFEKVIGIVSEQAIQDAMRNRSIESPVSNFISQRYGIVNIDEKLPDIIDQMKSKSYTSAIVMDYGKAVGVISIQIINKIIQENQEGPGGVKQFFKRKKQTVES